MPKNTRDDFWDVPPLASEDQKLVDAYLQVGKPLDQLPYSRDFEELLKKLGDDGSGERKYLVFQRLLQLRKKGALPRIGKFGVEY